MVPLSEIDPAKDLLIFIPGIGLNFQDAHTIAELDDTYQVVIGIYDRNQPLDRNAELLSESIEDLAKYRAHLAREAAIEYRGDLRLIGHSLGGLIGTLVLVNLDEGGLIGNGPDSQFFRVNFVNIDAPWRGFDVPWVLTLPGVNHVVHELFPKIPLPERVSRSALSVINRTRSMDVVLSSRLPDSVDVTLVSVIPLPEELQARGTEPVDGWSSEELSDVQLKRIRQYLASDQRFSSDLGEWAWGRAIRKQELQQLMNLLEWDADYARYGEDLRNVSGRASNLEDFKAGYDGVISAMIDTFRGQHTRFMWEDDAFLPWLREVLKRA
jgi:pimeloyl-ACP methyl ester carboxylesterase